MSRSELLVALEEAQKAPRGPRMKRGLGHPVRMALPGLLRKSRWPREGIHRTATLFSGERMRVRLPERVSVHLWRYGFIEPNLSRILLGHLQQDMVFFDVGAHYGYFSVLGSQLVGPGGEVHAFEPSPDTFRLLVANTRNREVRVVCNNVALWSESTTLEYRTFGAEFSAFNSLFHPRLQGAEKDRALSLEQRHQIPTRTLDEYVREQGVSPDVIKIDAENAELEILRGAVEVMDEHRPVITVEVGDGPDDQGSRAALDFALSHGYRPFDYVDGDLQEHELRTRYGRGNIVLIPD